MSAIGLPSYSSEIAIRPMSLTDFAPRKASRKLSETRFRERNSMSLVIIRVQEKTEANSKPTITNFTTILASMNIVPMFILPAWAICGGWLGSAGAAAAGAAAAGAVEAAAASAAGVAGAAF